MAFESKSYIPQSVNQLKKEYLETPFWFSRFGPGSQIIIVEDQPIKKPLRFIMKPSQKGGPAFATNLIKITDGFVEKDLELSKTNAQMLFLTLPDTIQNLKGCTFANDNGRWIYIAQTTPETSQNFPKSDKIAASMEPAPTEIGNLIKMLHQAMQLNQSVGKRNDSAEVIAIADKLNPGDALNLINEAKKQGWIVESNGIFRAE